ncbi:PREDICTED: proline-rich proteoglycan 2-like [Cercocebus atys]|uniref:proline-rich proteoglycan 2-like n=1 Tax=Cercocebus atys TaxID=9531 RepID=UPI0005F4A4C8|nr:PREDICTED: proline-rich proteoglycan 2-like [Cercocebus atys]
MFGGGGGAHASHSAPPSAGPPFPRGVPARGAVTKRSHLPPRAFQEGPRPELPARGSNTAPAPHPSPRRPPGSPKPALRRAGFFLCSGQTVDRGAGQRLEGGLGGGNPRWLSAPHPHRGHQSPLPGGTPRLAGDSRVVAALWPRGPGRRRVGERRRTLALDCCLRGPAPSSQLSTLEQSQAASPHPAPGSAEDMAEALRPPAALEPATDRQRQGGVQAKALALSSGHHWQWTATGRGLHSCESRDRHQLNECPQDVTLAPSIDGPVLMRPDEQDVLG